MDPNRPWERWQIGDHVGSVVITGIDIRGPAQMHCYYRVVYDCCGSAGELNHRVLRRRILYGREMCHACAKRYTGSLQRARADHKELPRRNPLPDYGVEMPLWPVPPSVAKA